MNEQRKKIFHVDDVNFQLLTMKNRLKDHYEVYSMQYEEDLFETLERVIPDLIILDVQMPDSDGFQIIRKLNKDVRYSRIPVVFLTGAKVDEESIAKGMNLGAYDFLTKPVSNEKLFECIEACIDPEKKAAEKPIILAVDDDPSVLKLLNNVLHEHYEMRTLANPLAAKPLIKQIDPDLFLLDCNMPGMNGFELVEVIRKTHGHEHTPIVFLTSEASIDHIAAATTLGVSDYIVKPINEAVLNEKLAKHLVEFKMHRRMRSIENDNMTD